MANNYLSSSITIRDITEKNKQKQSIKDKMVSFKTEVPDIDTVTNVKILNPGYVEKVKKPKTKNTTSQGVIRRIDNTKITPEPKPVTIMETKPEVEILTPKKKNVEQNNNSNGSKTNEQSKKVNNQNKSNNSQNKSNNSQNKRNSLAIKNNSMKHQNYGSERKIVDDFDFYLDKDDVEQEKIEVKNKVETLNTQNTQSNESKQQNLHTTSKSRGGLKIVFLGGVGEIGKNMTAFEYGGEIIVIDCGSSFPDDNQLGIDLVVPDITYLTDNASKIKAILLTHGHEDHIGALPYILDKINVPIYGSKLTLGLVKSKFTEKNNRDIKLNFVCIDNTSNQNNAQKKSSAENKMIYEIGKHFKVEFVPTCHSIAGSMMLFVQTPQVNFFHTGDFKIDFTPVGNIRNDLTRLAEIGKKGVDLLLCESTNVDRKGYSMSESSVGKSFEEIFEKNISKRLVVATFASNISRLQQIISLCEKYNRKVVITGRSMLNVTEIASSEEINELKFNKNLLCDIEDIGDYKDKELLVLCTGSQGEYKSALTRMAMGEFPKINLGVNDTVIISASPIPGNEKSINNTINNLYRIGCEVIYSELADVHVSGHGCQEEIKLIHNLINPKYFIPVHGEYRHLKHHKDLAINLGMREENIMICDIGSCVSVTKNGLKMLDPVPSGISFVDGLGMGDTDSMVLKERYVLANEGICIVTVSISKRTCNLTSDPEIVTRGLVYKDESSALILEAKEILKDKIKGENYSKYDSNKVKNDIKKEMQKFFVRATNRKPMILTILLENMIA